MSSLPRACVIGAGSSGIAGAKALHERGIPFDCFEKSDGVWEVELDSGEWRRYDALLVANGHHWDPRWPEPPFPGRFDGRQMHAHEYKDSEEFRDRRVVILGMGNSAMDLAVDASYVARA